MKTNMYYQTLCILMCLFMVIHCHIYSAKPKVTYSYSGQPAIYHIFLALEDGIAANDYLKITWPQALHLTTVKNAVTVKLVSFSNNLQIVTTTFISSPADVSPVYYVTFGYELTADKWYEIKIYPTKAPTIYTGLIQIASQSDYGSDPIVYDTNLAFEYIAIDTPLSPTGNLTVAVSSTSSQRYRTASIYDLNIDITPTITNTLGGNFTLQIYYDSTLASHILSGTTLIDFSFMGLCQSIQSPSNFTAVLNYCEISTDLSTIKFSISSITAGKTIRITTSISNPLYISTRTIRAFWVDFVSGKVMQNGEQNNALIVNPISIIAPTTGRVYLLWGIDKDYTGDTNMANVNLAIYKASGSNLGPFNSFNIGFMINETSPINGEYKVIVKLGATGLLEGSIAHNFPALSGKKVYCQYDTTNKYIECKNVGAFINTNSTSYRYFISGKAHYSSATASSISNFGDIEIRPIVKNSAGTLLSVELFTDLVNPTPMPVSTSSQFLDTSGYHSTSMFKIGNAQVVSASDNNDNELTSTGDAIMEFLQGTNSTVGIVPDLGVSQQLLFLLKVPTVSTGIGSSKSYYTKLLYNNKVIGFQSGAETRGLDFVGYDSTAGSWSISSAPCHQTNKIVCEKYNFDTPTKNIQVRVNQTSTYNNYGMYQFSCGDAYAVTGTCTSDCSAECNLFGGYGLTNLKSGVISMRKVTFPSNYYSSVYADDTLMDFLLVFIHGSVTVSSSLINSYTVVGKKLQNIKASYVNYYDHINTNYNKGIRIPMMLRIGGGVLPLESRGATVMGVFFDDNIDAMTFWSTKGESFSLGCSTNTCEYFPNNGVNIPRNDIWHTNRAVYFSNIPSIQNQFNLLVPVTPSSNRAPPTTLTLAFFSTNHSIAEATGLYKTLSVYRLFGSAVTSPLSGAIGTINSLSRRGDSTASQGSMPTSNFNSFWTQSGTFTYAINTSNIYANPPNNTFTYGVSYSTTYGSSFGAGITLTSFYYNIFASSTLAFESPPTNTATTCTIFGYLYNELDSPGTNLDRNAKWIYTAFCPIDSAMSTNIADANIKFINPQYPNVFSNSFPLSQILAYSYSDPFGNLKAYRLETNGIGAFTRTCTTSKLQPYKPYDTVALTGAGKQRATFTVTTSQIQMSNVIYDGYSKFRVRVALPASTVNSSLSMQSGCEVSDSLLSCNVVTTGSSNSYTEIIYSGTGSYTVTSFQLSLYAKTTGFLGAAADYTLTIELPQYRSSSNTIFGDTFTTITYLCQCTSSFTVGITSNGASMILTSPVTLTNFRNARSPISFNFGSSSYRQTFFSTSQYRFNYGFLTTPASADQVKGNFRCLVYENLNSNLVLSTRWKSLTLSNFASVYLSPKAQINDPASILYTMKCYGSGVPTNSNVTNISLTWFDGGDTVQSATQISPPTYLAQPGFSLSFSLSNKRFKTEGFKSFYTFTISSTLQNFDQNTRLYFNFHFKVSSKLDSQGAVECYARTSSLINDTAATFSYCEFVTERQLILWNTKVITANTGTLYIDIYNIDQPKVADINTANQLITLTVDLDSDYSNGFYGSTTVGDTSPLANTAATIQIIETSINTTYIRSPQTITIRIKTPSNLFTTAGKNLYLILPSSYAEWINRGTVKSLTECQMVVTGLLTNLVTACSFISKRILKMTISGVTQSDYSITINNLYSPSSLPSGKNNQFRFKLFVADAAESVVTHYSFFDYSKQLTLNPDSTLIDLSWKEYTLAQGDSLITLTSSTTISKRIYIGYYSNVIELRQSKYPSNFETSMQLSLKNFLTNQFSSLSSISVKLGKSSAYYRFSANTTVSAGLYVLQMTKTGDSKNLYTVIPPLTLVVSNTLCALNTNQLSYTLPVGGFTLPIVIDALKCIPLEGIMIGVTFDKTGVAVNTDLSSLSLTKDSLDGKIYIVLKHNNASLTSGQVVVASFIVSGINAASYSTIPSISITIVDPTSYLVLPSATALSQPLLSANTAKFTLQCNMASTIYWGLGIYPSILNSQASDFQARIISQLKGLNTNFTEKEDIYGRVYGVNQVTTTQTLPKTLYNLKSNTDYIFKYFCVNLLGYSSDSQSVSFTSLNYGAYLMKISMTFRGPITYQQYHDLSCSLAQNFLTPYQRVMTEVMSYCQFTSTLFYPTLNSQIANLPDTNGQYLYNFYILPDYTLPTDNTNVNVRSLLSLHSFTTQIITSTASSASLPSFVQMQTEDIQVFTTPIVLLNDALSGLNSVIVTGVLTNMNGFFIVGIMAGEFNTQNMILPTTENLKKGLFEKDKPLLSVKMQYAPQNFNVSVNIGELTAATSYTIFYFGTSDDPTYNALTTAVQYTLVRTLQVLDIDINWNSKTTFTLVVIIAFLWSF